MSKQKQTYSGADLRALREVKLAEQADPMAEAARREASFLGNLSRAQDDYEWLVANEAWKLLGFENFADWWEARVQPLMRGLSMRPTRELARDAADRIRADEAELPPSMRRREAELAEFVGVGRDELRDRPARSSSGGNPPKDDLADPVEPAPEPVEQASEDVTGEASASTVPAGNEGLSAATSAPSATAGAPPAVPRATSSFNDWTSEETELRKRIEAGETVVVTLRGAHARLISWADEEDLFRRIDRKTEWGNPFELPADGDRPTVIANYAAHYLPHKPSLLSKVHALRGKALGCWCAPEACHGHVLARFAEAAGRDILIEALDSVISLATADPDDFVALITATRGRNADH